MDHQRILVVMMLMAMVLAMADKEKGGDESKRLFMLKDSKQVVKTEAGEVKVISGPKLDRDMPNMHIGFISMEPNSLFIPQYIDANLIFFVRRGEVKMGWIYKDEYVEKKLKMGDVNFIPAGSAFYMVNTGIGQRLQIICSIDASQTIGSSSYHPFYIAGGINPSSVLFGFDMGTLTTALNATAEEIGKVMTSRTDGAIVFIDGKEAEPPAKFMKRKLKEMSGRRDGDVDVEDGEEIDDGGVWTWRKMLSSLLKTRKGKAKGPVRAPDSYNLYDSAPDFKNKYGWSLALDENEYEPLKHSDFGVYLVNLTGGTMLAPHVNPRATEFGVVLGGEGRVQVVFPNGTMAMNEEVSEGDVFWVPRYFPFCHIASRSGPMEFFGFTTAARRNWPQFLAGARSLLKTMMGPELAAGFGVNQTRLRRMVEAQKEELFLPTWPVKEEFMSA
ncbi:vicilin-like seed storage protein At2g28490 [Dioscorea cayenensis subsp. rotundata]|uniref:Vicilin-like seed storage protein At2g28490 n=1 Tax=Dioscorea cayennensis subsp. rotundata TaxID=55577 RepID=A0AB40CA17_DIOCR|nr:vicilin-like seed storage protein At2g28490 [Dioscorea cayenensis subsp. rotundata]